MTYLHQVMTDPRIASILDEVRVVWPPLLAMHQSAFFLLQMLSCRGTSSASLCTILGSYLRKNWVRHGRIVTPSSNCRSPSGLTRRMANTGWASRGGGAGNTHVASSMPWIPGPWPSSASNPWFLASAETRPANNGFSKKPRNSTTRGIVKISRMIGTTPRH